MNAPRTNLQLLFQSNTPSGVQGRSPMALVLAPGASLIFATILFATCGEPMGPNTNPDDVMVSAAQRLKDYRELSRYPDDSQPANASTAELKAWPGIAGQPAPSGARIVAYDGEELRNGSLYIFVKVNVESAGRYSFVTVLETADGARKLAVSRPTLDLPAGPARVALPFYGLILHEARTGGPYRLRGVIGERMLTADDIDRMTSGGDPAASPEGALPALKAEYRTAQYDLARFTTREHDSPEKRQRLRELEAEARAEAEAAGN